jgi:amidase
MAEAVDDLDATGLAAAIREGELTAREAVEQALARIDERNETLNAVTEQCADAALAQVETGVSGPFAGVPFVTKDLGVDVAGLRSTGGSRLRADVVAMTDSLIVERYRAAGLVIVGSTNSPELGRSASTEPVLHGPTRNPYDLSRSPGGSSGGTAAAVAAGIVPAGHGNDGGGSIRIPASACGLVGLKPSRGRTPSLPRLTAFAYPLGINHALTRTVRDSAALLDVASGTVPGEAYVAPATGRPYADAVDAAPGRLRIAWSTATPPGITMDDECVAGTRRTAALLDSLGHDVEETPPPYPIEEVGHAMRVVMTTPIAAEIDARLEELGRELREDDLEPFTHVLYGFGKATSGTQYVAALQAVERAGLRLGPFFEDHDVLLTPTLPVAPPPLGLLDTTDPQAMYTHAAAIPALTSFCNVTGQPAISLPLEHFADCLPMGMQLVAALGREDLLLALAGQLEQAQPWSTAPVWPPRAG